MLRQEEWKKTYGLAEPKGACQINNFRIDFTLILSVLDFCINRPLF